ncbi:MAG: site-specific DNA-methyltransferase [Candidatus Symbiobacter sp.]|nr:site-specific DNA-methyltransferase [Candidatus Symbiobacter sp.]
MPSLLHQLPDIVERGKKLAAEILERTDSGASLALQTRELVITDKDTQSPDFLRRAERLHYDLQPADSNRLIYGDNLLAMAGLLAGDVDTPSLRGKIDLIYIDPPFDSKADYRTKISLPATSGTKASEIEQGPTAIEQFAYSDTWQDGTASYLSMMVPRLVLMRELLSESGSIYVHLDRHVSHYMKIVLDDIFGKDNFASEITWKRKDSNRTTANLSNVVDNLFYYRKSETYIWNEIFLPYSQDRIDKAYNNVDEFGRKFALADLMAPGQSKGTKSDYEWNGVRARNGRHWAYTKDKMLELDKEGKIFWNSNGIPKLKMYLDEAKGTPLSNLWIDIPMLKNNEESVNYGTQKPELLIERIIAQSSNQNSIVADFFVGSGTTVAVAEKLRKKWIATDIGKPACLITRKRLIDQEAKPFIFQHIGDYQMELARSVLGQRFRIGDLAQTVLKLYPNCQVINDAAINERNLGQIIDGRKKTLVYVDSPNKQTGYQTIRKLQQMKENFLGGGWDRALLLGWNFDPSLAAQLSMIPESERPIVRVIPANLLDEMKKRGEKIYDGAKDIRFTTLQYLKLKPIERVRQGDSESLTISLDDYILLDPHAMNIANDADRERVINVYDQDPLALIEYWSVDPNYNGRLFRSVWQDFRGNDDNDGDVMRVTNTARLTNLPVINATRRVCVRVVDIFGFEAEAIQEVAP